MIKVTFYITREQVIALDRIGAKSLQAGVSSIRLGTSDTAHMLGVEVNWENSRISIDMKL